ncbi:MAG TPA: NlpC/P60 family protein [Crocinitomix sp.]|nr:NlpC/P60 family protein [Crocinitomix sp.]
MANEDSLTYSKRDSLVGYAKSFLETPYVWGGTSPKGFDCSGFLYYVFKHFNIKVSRSSSGYNSLGKTIDLESTLPADILVFTGTNSSIKKPGHVGMVISNRNGVIKFIHASSSKKHFGVTITTYNNSGYVKRFLKAITVL